MRHGCDTVRPPHTLVPEVRRHARHDPRPPPLAVGSDLAADRLYVVPVRIEYEGGVVAWRVTFGHVAKSGLSRECCVRLGRRAKGNQLRTSETRQNATRRSAPAPASAQ